MASVCECIGVIQNAVSCLMRFRQSRVEALEGFLEELSDWFVIERGSACGAGEVVFFKPNEVFSEVLSASSAYCGGAYVAHDTVCIGDDFSFRAIVGHDGVMFLPNVKRRDFGKRSFSKFLRSPCWDFVFLRF